MEYFNANASLVRLLKDGTRRPPSKTAVMRMHPAVKPLNVDVTETHPDLLENYRHDAAQNFEPVSHDDLAEGTGEAPPDFDKLLKAVIDVSPGDSGAATYHRAVENLLTALFYPALDMPVIEQDMNEGRKRIDIDYTNIAARGFFYWLHAVHNVNCSFVPVECKNYTRKLANPEYDQLIGRFTAQRGYLGILCFRGFTEKDSVLSHCRDAALAGQGYIIALDDDDLTALVEQRKLVDSGDDYQFIWDRFKQLI